jgi:hypothetical protein
MYPIKLDFIKINQEKFIDNNSIYSGKSIHEEFERLLNEAFNNTISNKFDDFVFYEGKKPNIKTRDTSGFDPMFEDNPYLSVEYIKEHIFKLLKK